MRFGVLVFIAAKKAVPPGSDDRLVKSLGMEIPQSWHGKPRALPCLQKKSMALKINDASKNHGDMPFLKHSKTSPIAHAKAWADRWQLSRMVFGH